MTRLVVLVLVAVLTACTTAAPPPPPPPRHPLVQLHRDPGPLLPDPPRVSRPQVRQPRSVPTLDHCAFIWDDSIANPIFGVQQFNVYVGTVSGGPYTFLGAWPVSIDNTHYGPTTNMCASLPDGAYFAVVTATSNRGSDSTFSNEVPFVLTTSAPIITAPPSAPTNLIIVP